MFAPRLRETFLTSCEAPLFTDALRCHRLQRCQLFRALAYSNRRWLYHGITIRRKVRCGAAIEDFAMVASALQTREMPSFGPFEPVPSERLLTKEGAPEMGAPSGRHFDYPVQTRSSAKEIRWRRFGLHLNGGK